MLRFAALLGTGALAVHQLRYLLAGHSPGGPEHAYLGPAGSLFAGLLVLALARALVGRAATAPRLRVTWPATACGLIGIYCVQELAEGVSPLGHGGWLALPLALLVAFGIALLTRSAGARDARPWQAPAACAEAATLAFRLRSQVRTAAPLLLPARGPPVAST
jgi:hypothetical protein